MGGSIVFFFSPYSKSVDHFLILECLLHPLPALTSMTLPKLTPPLSQPLEDLERGASGKQGSGGGNFPLRDIHKWNIMPCIQFVYTVTPFSFTYRKSHISHRLFIYNFSLSNRYTEYDCTKGILNEQGRGLALGNDARVGLDGRSHLGAGELLDLLRCAADEGGGVEKGVQLRDDGGEERVAADALDEVVVLALLLDVVGSFAGENTCVR